MRIVVRFTPAGLTAERLTPVLAEVGIKAQDPPAHFEVHNIFKR